MRVVSLNVNGLRASAKKGLFSWLESQKPDFLCFQEIKAHVDDLGEELRTPFGMYSYFHCAEKKGYSGVAVYCKKKPKGSWSGFKSLEFDKEGRLVMAEYENLILGSIYFPSGTSGDERQAAKMRFLAEIEVYLKKMLKKNSAKKHLLFCGDVNIAHKEIDLKNWKTNQKNSGFLPEEREWLNKCFGAVGLVDVHRKLEPNKEVYTWWSQRGNAFKNDVGWRIDYHLASPSLADLARAVCVYREPKWSDHAPLVIDYDFDV